MDERSRRVASRLEIPMLVAALLVIPTLAIEFSSLGPAWKDAAAVLDWLIWGAFAAEAAVMLWIVPRRGLWLLRHPLEVAIVVVTLPLLPGVLQGLRLARLASPLRLLRVLWIFRTMTLTRTAFSMDGLKWVALLAVITVLGGGAAFAHVEHLSAWDGVWWAINTATTVGYGPPVTTTGGRVVGIVVELIGIGFLAILTGAIAQRFVAEAAEEEGAAAPRPASAAGEERILSALAEIRDEVRGVGDLEARLERLEAALLEPAGERRR